MISPLNDPRKKYIILQKEKQLFNYYRPRVPLDNLGKHVVQKIDFHFSKFEMRYIDQALWCYGMANKMYKKTLMLPKYHWRSRERIIRKRDIQAMKGFLLKDIITWETGKNYHKTA